MLSAVFGPAERSLLGARTTVDDHGRPWTTMVDHGRVDHGRPMVDQGRPWSTVVDHGFFLRQRAHSSQDDNARSAKPRQLLSDVRTLRQHCGPVRHGHATHLSSHKHPNTPHNATHALQTQDDRAATLTVKSSTMKHPDERQEMIVGRCSLDARRRLP